MNPKRHKIFRKYFKYLVAAERAFKRGDDKAQQKWIQKSIKFYDKNFVKLQPLMKLCITGAAL